MSSVNNPAQNDFVQTYVTPPAAAYLAIIPAFYGLQVKSELQSGNPRPKFNFFEVLKTGSTKVAPTAGLVVGSQLVAQNFVEKNLFSGKKRLDSKEKATSTVATALVTSPFLACLNGTTMGKSLSSSLRSMTFKQVSVITCRETAFLGGLAAADPLSEAAKKYYCEGKRGKDQTTNAVVEYGSAYVGGLMGSVCGHFFDTALTRYQKNLPVTWSFHQLRQGMGWRAFLGVGVFSVAYKFATNQLKTASEQLH